MSVKRICRANGCHRLVGINETYCPDHQPEAKPRSTVYFEGVKQTEWRNLYSSKRWKELSSKCLEENPTCQKCRGAASTEVHHVIPHRGDKELFYDADNLVALCHPCHSAETRREAQERAQERKRGKLWY